MDFRWSELKSARLKKTRGASFEEVAGSRLIAIEKHSRLEHQRMMMFDYCGYVWVVPCVEDDGVFFLKTLYRSRKFTRKYLGGGHEKNQTDEI